MTTLVSSTTWRTESGWTQTNSGASPSERVVFVSPQQPLKINYFDLEVRQGPEAFNESWDAVRARGGVSIACVWDSESGRDLFFDDFSLSALADQLEQADVVVTFFGREFDIPLVEQHLGRKLALKEHLDLYERVRNALERDGKARRGYKLGQIASRTLGLEKMGDGKRAPELARQGRWAELVSYCQHDVFLTRKLAEFVGRHGYIIDTGGDKLELAIPEWFRDSLSSS